MRIDNQEKMPFKTPSLVDQLNNQFPNGSILEVGYWQVVRINNVFYKYPIENENLPIVVFPTPGYAATMLYNPPPDKRVDYKFIGFVDTIHQKPPIPF